jgi:hypothetical protein
VVARAAAVERAGSWTISIGAPQGCCCWMGGGEGARGRASVGSESGVGPGDDDEDCSCCGCGWIGWCGVCGMDGVSPTCLPIVALCPPALLLSPTLNAALLAYQATGGCGIRRRRRHHVRRGRLLCLLVVMDGRKEVRSGLSVCPNTVRLAAASRSSSSISSASRRNRLNATVAEVTSARFAHTHLSRISRCRSATHMCRWSRQTKVQAKQRDK